MAQKWADWLHHPCRMGGPRRFIAGEQNQKWSASGQIGHHPCDLGGAQRFKAGDKISSGPQVGRLAPSPLPFGGCPTLHNGGQNQPWEVFLFFDGNHIFSSLFFFGHRSCNRKKRNFFKGVTHFSLFLLL